MNIKPSNLKLFAQTAPFLLGGAGLYHGYTAGDDDNPIISRIGRAALEGALGYGAGFGLTGLANRKAIKPIKYTTELHEDNILASLATGASAGALGAYNVDDGSDPLTRVATGALAGGLFSGLARTVTNPANKTFISKATTNFLNKPYAQAHPVLNRMQDFDFVDDVVLPASVVPAVLALGALHATIPF